MILAAKIAIISEYSCDYPIFLLYIRLSQYVKERLRQMQSHACLGYAEAMVLFEAKPHLITTLLPLFIYMPRFSS